MKSAATMPTATQSSIQIFDKAMCCSTGVCGPEVDPVLPRFAADLDWLKSQGHTVQRFNLAHDPAAFAQNESIKSLLASQGVACLPVIIIDGTIVSQASYPTRDEFAQWIKLPLAQPRATALPVLGKSVGCCGSEGCC